VVLTSSGYWQGSCRWDHACRPYCGRAGHENSPIDGASFSSAVCRK